MQDIVNVEGLFFIYLFYFFFWNTVSVILVWKYFFLTTVQCQAHITVKPHAAMSIFAMAPGRPFSFLRSDTVCLLLASTNLARDYLPLLCAFCL